MVDAILRFAFRLTGSRAIADIISERRVERRWKTMERAALARGASVVTIASRGGTASYVMEA